MLSIITKGSYCKYMADFLQRVSVQRDKFQLIHTSKFQARVTGLWVLTPLSNFGYMYCPKMDRNKS